MSYITHLFRRVQTACAKKHLNWSVFFKIVQQFRVRANQTVTLYPMILPIFNNLNVLRLLYNNEFSILATGSSSFNFCLKNYFHKTFNLKFSCFLFLRDLHGKIKAIFTVKILLSQYLNDVHFITCELYSFSVCR